MRETIAGHLSTTHKRDAPARKDPIKPGGAETPFRRGPTPASRKRPWLSVVTNGTGVVDSRAEPRSALASHPLTFPSGRCFGELGGYAQSLKTAR